MDVVNTGGDNMKGKEAVKVEDHGYTNEGSDLSATITARVMTGVIGIVGIGMVGMALYKSFLNKGISVLVYDNTKNVPESVDSVDHMGSADMIFLCLPTPFDSEARAYDKAAIWSTCEQLKASGYSGVIVNKSTIEPGETERLATSTHLRLLHNPEFLSAATALQDFDQQTHIVIGSTSKCDTDPLQAFFSEHYPKARISCCSANESELMKLSANCFYATKIQFFTEVYLCCQHVGADYNTVQEMIQKNGWISPMHTKVPGTDGQISYGGACFPKDMSAFAAYLDNEGLDHAVVEAAARERATHRILK